MVQKRWICVALVLLNVLCYGHVCFSEFVNYDDTGYVTENPFSSGGLSWTNIAWAFGESCYQAGFWIPLTWLSLQMDATLYGPGGAWGFHLSNLLIHLANVIGLFLVLQRMTGDVWRSAVAVALYSIHPLRVESVAWVTERKDVLSTFFLIVAVGAYHRYTQGPNVRFYLLSFLAFCLGLMAKPTLVTLPFALFLLDYWPLGRLRLGQALTAEQAAKPGTPWWRLAVEKIPFFAASALVSTVTLHFSSAIGAVSSLPLRDRLGVALSGYLSYVEKTLWPTNLSAMYPLQIPSAARLAAAAMVLGVITVAVVWLGRRKPALLVGWLWFVGTLLPVSGIAQTGPQGFADRFTYVPHIGIAIMIVWGLGDLSAWQRLSVGRRGSLVGICLAGLGALTWVQVCYWRNSGILFEHALSITEKNFEAHFCLSCFWFGRADLDQAALHAGKAVEINPANALGQFQFGTVLLQQDDFARAAAHLKAYVHLAPDDPDGFYTLGLALSKQGRWQEAKENLHRSLEIWVYNPPKKVWRGDPGRRKALPLELLGEIALHDGFPDQAVEHLTQALRAQPELALAHHFLGVALGRRGDWPEAETALHQAVTLEPEAAAYRAYLAFAYARQKKMALAAREYALVLTENPVWPQQTSDLALRSITETPFLDQRLAEEVALQVCEATTFKDARWLSTLAAVQAAGGQFDAARATAQKALGLAEDRALRAELEERLHRFERRLALPVKNADDRP